MTFGLGLGLVAVVAVFVAWPLFTRAGEEITRPVEVMDRIDALESQKLAAYGAIKDAEFDHEMGKLSDTDFDVVREKYVSRAIEAIAGLEELKGPAEKTKGSAKPAAKAGRPSTLIAYCPECGTKVPDAANFCSNCGRELAAPRDAVA